MSDDRIPPAASAPAAPEERPRWSTPRVLLILVPIFLLLAFPIGFWPDSLGTPHEYLAIALYERGDTNLNQEVFEFDFHRDVVFRKGRFHSNKAPGPAFWLLPAMLLIDAVTPGPVELAPLCYFGRLLMLTLPFLLFLFLLGRCLERLAPPAVAWGLVVAFALGTNAGAYAVLYFSHMIAGMALAGSFLLLWRRPDRLRWVAGLASGFAIASEYQTVAIVAVLAALSAFDAAGRFRWRSLLLFGVGVALVMGLLLAYHKLAFGGATEIGYTREFRDFKVGNTNALGFGVSKSTPQKLLAMWFSPSFGLFFFSPWLLLFFPAVISVWRRRTADRRFLLGSVVAALALSGVICMHAYWIGGSVVGPRYLTAGLAFFLFPIAAFLGNLGGIARRLALGWLIAGTTIAAAFHFLIMAVIRTVDTHPGHLMQNPLGSYVLPMIQEGRGALTVAHHLGASAVLSNVIFGVLFAAPILAYAWFGLCAVSRRERFLFSGCAVAGLALFAAWPFIGTSEGKFAKRHRDWVMSRPGPADLPRLEGSLYYLQRPRALTPPERAREGRVHRFNPAAMEEIFPTEPRFEKIASHLRYAKGAAWMTEGFLVFSDLRKNAIFRYDPEGKLSFYRTLSGYASRNVSRRERSGSNGLAVDNEGRLLITENGNRRVTRLERDGKLTVLADKFDGKRLNGPGSVAVRSDGTIYFTDPDYTIRRRRARELKLCGIYRIKDGKLDLLNRQLDAPQGLAFSPDEQFLYVGNWKDRRFRDLLRFRVLEDGSLVDPRPFFPMREKPVRSMMDGLAVDRLGNVYFCSHDGIWIFSPAGRPLGIIQPPNPPSSIAFGDEDRQTLYITAYVNLYRVRVGIPGAR